MEASKPKSAKQRLLYIHAQTPNILSPIIEMTPYEPVTNFEIELSAEEPNFPYQTVHEAILDGWRIIQFPHHQAEFDDDDIDMIGYQFILEKMEIM